MVSVGFLVNLASLLLSPPDNISPLTGYQLVQTKVVPYFFICVALSRLLYQDRLVRVPTASKCLRILAETSS